MTILAPTYYRHHHPELGLGVVRIHGGPETPFVVLCSKTHLYATHARELERSNRQEYDSVLNQTPLRNPIPISPARATAIKRMVEDMQVKLVLG